MAEHGLKPSIATVVRRAGRMEKLITLLLLFILLTAAMAGVTTVLTGPDWAVLWESLLLGLLAGWVLAIFRWQAWRSALLLVALGVLFCLLFAGGLSGKFLAVFGELFRLVGQVISSLSFKAANLTPLNDAAGQALSSIGVVVGRVYSWVKDLLTAQPVFDPVATGIVWSIVVWLVAAWAGWVVEAHKNALAAVLPGLILNLSILSYGRNNSVSIYLLLGLTLVLVSVVQYGQREHEWNTSKVAYPAHKSREVGNISLVMAILLVVVAATISSLSIQRLIQWTSEIRGSSSQSESGLAKSLGIQPAATATPDSFTNLRNPSLPRELLIGSGPELSTEYVMSVEVKNLASLGQGGRLPPPYWRSFTYDIYTGHGWSSSATQLVQYQPDQPIQAGQQPGHLPIQEVVRPVPAEQGTLYAAGEPVQVSIASSAAWRSSTDLFGMQTGKSDYVVQSLFSVADETSLRKAGEAYPGWVAKRYLAIPAEVPSRVKELAIQLTAADPTPYDRARAIEGYLRQNYPYTLDVPHPPANQDLVDYFLFDLRKGYCDYFASAMVILARAAGIPARLAIGYASGTYNENSGRFIVTQADAHSWVEVYFPGIGWVPFEPTAGLPPINRANQPNQIATPPPPSTPASPPGTVLRGNIAKLTGYLLLAFMFTIGVAWAILDEVSLRRQKAQATAREVYRRLRRFSNLLSVTMEGGETPYELLAGLSNSIRAITRPGAAAAGESTLENARRLVREIVRICYRPASADTASGVQIVQLWDKLRWQLRLMWILKSWERLGHQFRNRLARIDRNPGAEPG